jgi:hypothetical protein
MLKCVGAFFYANPFCTNIVPSFPGHPLPQKNRQICI